MDFGTQENEIRTSGYGGSHLTKESSGEKRRLGGVVVGNNNIIHNGTPTVLSPYQQQQTLEHHQHSLQPHHLEPVPLSSTPISIATKTDPDPDRLGSSTAVAPAPPPAVRPIINKPSSTKTTTTATSTTTNNNVRYRECLKNHAANIGGNVFDGCGEFMPCGEEGSLEALKCAACDCHRNFHRKEVDGETTPFGGGGVVTTSSRSRSIMLSPLQLPAPPLQSPNSSAGLHHHYRHNRHHQKSFSIVQPMSVAFGGGGAGTESSSEDLNVYNDNADGVGSLMAAAPYGLSSKKRFRTKFTAEQKERMVEFAERVGWRIQKQDEDEVERFCAEVGVKRQVLRVWMHNNKNTAAVKRMQQHDDVDITATTGKLALENNNVEAAADQQAVA